MAQSNGRIIDKLIKKWAQFRCRRPQTESANSTLVKLLKAAKATRFGREFGFDQIIASENIYQSFCERLPVIDYAGWVAWLADLNPHLEEGPRKLIHQSWPGVIDTFCLSSGTSSGRTKYVPYSKEMIRINQKAAVDLIARLVLAGYPLLSKSLYMSGCTNLERNRHGVLAGDMSAITKFLAPAIAKRFTLPPQNIAAIDDWSERLNALVELCKGPQSIHLLSGIPVWQLTLLEQLNAEDPAYLDQFRFLIHGGMSITPYRQRIESLLPDDAQLIEVYAASEIGIAAFQVPGEQGMRFFNQYQVFYEFEDENGQILPIQSIQADIAYNLIISSCAGLWRYRIGDQLVFKTTDPLVLDRVQRDKTMSTFDEKVTEFECQTVMQQMSPSMADYSVGPDIENRRHVWFLLTDELLSEEWIQKLDHYLRLQNQDYDDYRTDGRINHPTFKCVNNRKNYLETIGRAEGGQRKFPRLLSSDEVSKLLKTPF